MMDLTNTYSKYFSGIKRKIKNDGYVPKTDVGNIAVMVCLHFDYVETIKEGKQLIHQFEESDKVEGIYEPDFYDVVDDDRCSVI